MITRNVGNMTYKSTSSLSVPTIFVGDCLYFNYFHLLNSSKSEPLSPTDVRATVLFLCDVKSPSPSVLKSNILSAESLISRQSQKRTLPACQNA